MKQFAFLIISSSPSLKNIAQNFKPLILAESPYFHRLWYSYLTSKQGSGFGIVAVVVKHIALAMEIVVQSTKVKKYI